MSNFIEYTCGCVLPYSPSAPTVCEQHNDPLQTTLDELIDCARNYAMTPEELEEQKQSWVRGEMALAEFERTTPLFSQKSRFDYLESCYGGHWRAVDDYEMFVGKRYAVVPPQGEVYITGVRNSGSTTGDRLSREQAEYVVTCVKSAHYLYDFVRKVRDSKFTPENAKRVLLNLMQQADSVLLDVEKL